RMRNGSPARSWLFRGMCADRLEVADPHHRQAVRVGALGDEVHVELRWRDVVLLDVYALVRDRFDRLALAERGDGDVDALVDADFFVVLDLSADLGVERLDLGFGKVEQR